MLLITGATGQLGTAVTQQLRQKNATNWAIFARDADKARRYTDQGIAARMGDFDDTTTLSSAFSDVRKLLLISSRSLDRSNQQKKVVDAARIAGVEHIVYTGLAIQNIATSHTHALMTSHFDTEAHIRASGMRYTFLRNTMYADALPEIIGNSWREHGMALPGGNGAVPYALRREMGEATANLLLQDGHEARVYNITGSASYSYQDIAHALSAITGNTVAYNNIDPAIFVQQIKAAGLPDFLVDLTAGTVKDVKDHQYELRSDTLRTLLGREPAGLQAMIKEVFRL
jgi:NAD(P)H dehydrogenase (quinone)